MFESDDFDQILSQLDLPETCSNTSATKTETQGKVIQDLKCDVNKHSINNVTQKLSGDIKKGPVENNIIESQINKENNQTSPKHSKRKMINTYFDHKNKRKFPGPAGLLNGTFEDSKEVDDIICHVELLSQDIDYSDSCYLHKNIFESPLWERLLRDTKSVLNVDSIRNIKQQALKQNLRHQKADIITAYVERVDRSAIDPLIVLRDTTDDIKCTLHRDAWVAFSPYIVSECCALVLQNPTVLTTGSAFKKHYLNITLSNIQAVYSSAIIKQQDYFPTGFSKAYEEEYTIIRIEKKNTRINHTTEVEDTNLLDGLDGAFSDIFS